MNAKYLMAVALGMVIASQTVWAAPGGRMARGRSIRSTGGASAFSRSRGGASGQRKPSRSIRVPSGGGNNGLSGLGDALSQLRLPDARSRNGYGRTPFNGRTPDLRRLGEFFGLEDRHDPCEEMADAYRDAAIANAVVNLVGVLVTASGQRCNPPAAAAVSAAPQPRYTVQPQAPAVRGHIEEQRILIREGHYEEYRVQVPEYTVPGTGERVLAHQETRRRWVEPVYEVREVWVPQR
jgi:hypothetical protein